jgi:hypothetical protein
VNTSDFRKLETEIRKLREVVEAFIAANPYALRHPGDYSNPEELIAPLVEPEPVKTPDPQLEQIATKLEQIKTALPKDTTPRR